MDKLISVPMGFLSGLEAQGEISELLDELFYRDNLVRSKEILSSRLHGPSPVGPGSRRGAAGIAVSAKRREAREAILG